MNTIDTQEKNYHIFTLGCQMNVNESERIKTIMERIGYQYTDSDIEADVILVNACSIRQTAIDRIYGRVVEWNKIKKKRPLTTILTGCVMDVDRKKLHASFDHIISRKDSIKIPALLGEEEISLADYLSVPPTYNSEYQGYVSIMEGCNKFCTFCVVPYTRGREISRSTTDILAEVKSLIARGYKEITLLGQNVNSYKGRDEAGNIVTFPQLLDMVAQVPGDFWVHFTTSHPYDMSDDLIEVMAKNKKVANYMNLPVQSGDDMVLKRMNRHYTVDWYKNRLHALRAAIPNIAISTDVIIGFCGETEAQWQNTVDLAKEVKYDMIYLNKYSNRKGTLASKRYEDDIPWQVKKAREKELNMVLHETAQVHNNCYLNMDHVVLVERSTYDEDKKLFVNNGRTQTNKAVMFESDEQLAGSFVLVKIIKANPFSLLGTYIEKTKFAE